MSDTGKAAKGKSYAGFTDDEKAAMKERAAELKKQAKQGAAREAGEADLLEKIAEMPPAEREIATRLHEIVTATAPELFPKTWYGMPAWARDEKIVFFFQPGEKFKTRFCTLGFQDPAALDDGSMWATAFAITKLTPEVEKRIAELVKKAVG